MYIQVLLQVEQRSLKEIFLLKLKVLFIDAVPINAPNAIQRICAKLHTFYTSCTLNRNNNTFGHTFYQASIVKLFCNERA